MENTTESESGLIDRNGRPVNLTPKCGFCEATPAQIVVSATMAGPAHLMTMSCMDCNAILGVVFMGMQKGNISPAPMVVLPS